MNKKNYISLANKAANLQIQELKKIKKVFNKSFVHAVDLIAQNKFDRMVAWSDRKVVDFPIAKGIETYKKVELGDSLVKTALALGIYLGDTN